MSHQILVAGTRADIGAKPYEVAIEAGHHQLIADEPRAIGGQDAGPVTFALLLSALGACTAITLRMYADRKQWPLEAAHVELRYLKQDDTASIDRKLTFVGSLTTDQRERLADAAERTPVTLALKAGLPIQTTLA